MIVRTPIAAETTCDIGGQKTQTAHYEAPSIVAQVGNIQIAADCHGMGFTCSIDGEPVKRLRSVTLRLEIDRPNTVTVNVLADHKR